MSEQWAGENHAMVRPGKRKAESSTVAGDGPKQRRTPKPCGKCGVRTSEMSCQRCAGHWHRTCAGIAKCKRTWTCAACVAKQVGARWDMTKVAALFAAARADGTEGTYDASVRRFVDALRQAPGGADLQWEDTAREEDVLAFLGEARGRWCTSTVEGTSCFK